MFEKIGAFFESFLSEYGAGFAMMILAGAIIAFVVEYAVKRAFDYLEKKYEGKDKMLALLSAAKMGAIFVVTIVMSVICTKLIVQSELTLPGNSALTPFWFAIIYAAQYVFSMKGIKGIIEIRHRPKKERVKKEKKVKVNPVANMERLAKNVYRDADGKLYDKKGVAL